MIRPIRFRKIDLSRLRFWRRPPRYVPPHQQPWEWGMNYYAVAFSMARAMKGTRR